MLSILKNFFIQWVLIAYSAGTTARKSDAVNMTGKQSVTFGIHLGTLTSTNVTTIKLQGSLTTTDGDFVDLAGASITVADTGGSKLYLLSVINPNRKLHKYVRAVVTPTVANAVITGGFAIAGVHPRNLPVTADASVGSSVEVYQPANA